MNNTNLKLLENGSDEDVGKLLKEFNSQHAKSFVFPDVSKEIKQQIISALIMRLEKSSARVCHASCLETMRVLSREKSGFDAMTTESALNLFVRHAGLDCRESDASPTIQDVNVMLEAQKCLCNIIFNSPAAQRICSMNGCVEGIVMRLKTYKDPELIHDIKFYDMRILFLLTALCADIRPRVRAEHHGLTYLIEVLDLTLRDAEERSAPLTDQDVDLACEILKILFNLTVSLDKQNLDEEEEAHFMRLVSVLHDLLTVSTTSKDKHEELQSHTVNLLTNMPADSYEELLAPMIEIEAAGGEKQDIEYDGKNMGAILALLDFLQKRLEKPQRSLKESLTPILHCLCECCRANRPIRKFCRIKVLPYMRGEVRNLPEDGNSLRNKLCKLLTSPVSEVKDLCADFLFVLCKENVARFVKYTGYGNAAGLLAQRGLMCGGRGSTPYESESEDSETEEFTDLKEMVNIVTGRWEEDKPDPMANMTEEQKEYEAMQLVNQLDKLHRDGFIQPVGLGEDGKPKPIGHILELQSAANQNASSEQQEEDE